MDQEKIGKFICTIRKQQGLTQEQLGERLGVTNKTVSRWETGRYMPDIDKLQELSAILGVSINELLAGERIEDATSFVKKADENLVAVLSNDSTFGLQDRIAYFKRKWLKEHKALILSGIILWYTLFAVGICMKQPIILALLPIVGLVIYGYIRNQMMIYVKIVLLYIKSSSLINIHTIRAHLLTTGTSGGVMLRETILDKLHTITFRFSSVLDFSKETTTCQSKSLSLLQLVTFDAPTNLALSLRGATHKGRRRGNLLLRKWYRPDLLAFFFPMGRKMMVRPS